MIDLKSNFKAGKKDLKCRLCDKHEENQQGLLLCPALNSEPVHRSLQFSEKKEKTTKIALILKEKFQIFQNLQVQGQSPSQPSAASSLNINLDDEDMG